jgi:nitrogen fixation NifU-like protein
MGDEQNDFFDDLQNQIYEEARADFGDVAFERWMRPLYHGTLENPDGYGRVTGSCGDTMQIFLRLENGNVKEAGFLTDGCGASAVCASFAAELSIGKTPDELLNISGETILEILGKFPKENQHCAFLAVETLQEAFNDYMVRTTKKRA